jgi:multisubunit Na+/H+ antiporter MnhG subunit
MPIFGLLFFFGVLHTPKLQERLTGIGIFILMGIIFIIFNIINYFIHRHKQPQEKIVKRVIISLVVIITCGIILYTAPDVWATINDWWF